ncbi:MAG: GNA1162 family protein [Thermodesulfobacteriota bacterium]
MLSIQRICLCVLLFVAAAMTMSCAHVATDETTLGIIATSEAFKWFDGEFENTGYFLKHKPASMAVLPFEYSGSKAYSIERKDENPAEIVRRGLYNHVSSLPFRDLEIFSTDRQLKNAGLTDIPKINQLIAENPKKLKSILGVDAVISGQVTHFDRIFIGIYSQVAVGCEVKMWDLESGKLLWRAKHVSRAHAGGLSINPIGLAMATVASVWNLRQTEMLSQTDALFREVVSTIDVPQSALAVQSPPPRIDLFAAMNSGKAFTLGEKVAFRLIGDPNGSAYVDLGDFKSAIPLAPVSAEMKRALQAEVLEVIKKNYKDTGYELTPEIIEAVRQELGSREVYEGSYTVEPQEEAYGLLAKGYLVNSAGVQKTALDVVHTIDVDSKPPQVVAGLTTESLDGKVMVRWHPSNENDLAGYEVWSSPTPLSGYSLSVKSEKNEAMVKGLANFAKIYIQVRALDRAANQGQFGKSVESVPLPAPGLFNLPQPGPVLGGPINEKILLVAEKSPYMVQSDLSVNPGGAVFMAPGVKLVFAPNTALVVDGGDLFAYGSGEKPIEFSSQSQGRHPGSWRGIVLNGAKRSDLRHVTIEGAVVGLTVRDSAPSIAAATIRGCSQAGLHLKDRAKPSIECSLFKDNEGQGGMVIEGEGVAPMIRNNVFEDNLPFQVQSYAPLKMNLSENFWGDSAPRAEWFLGDIDWRPALSSPPGNCAAK